MGAVKSNLTNVFNKNKLFLRNQFSGFCIYCSYQCQYVFRIYMCVYLFKGFLNASRACEAAFLDLSTKFTMREVSISFDNLARM